MEKYKENLEGVVSKLKEQGVKAGEAEKKRIVEDARKEAEQIIADAKTQSKDIVEKAKTQAEQDKKNATAAIEQASRDMIEATKIAIINHLKNTFGDACKTLLTEEQYLQEILKTVLETIKGNKTVKVEEALAPKMESYIIKQAFEDKVEIKPLAEKQARIEVSCDDKEGIQFILTAKDVEEGLFELLNKDLVERITQNKEA